MKKPDRVPIKGIVEWIVKNPGQPEQRGVVENVACDGLFDALVAHMVAGAADTEKAVTVMQLGDDTTTQEARDDAGCNSPINGDGNLTDVDNVTGTLTSTAASGSYKDTFNMSNTWTNNGTTDSAGEVCVKTYGTDGTDGVACGHAIFVNPAVSITAPGGTLTINYKFIFAPA